MRPRAYTARLHVQRVFNPQKPFVNRTFNKILVLQQELQKKVLLFFPDMFEELFSHWIQFK